MGGCLRGCDSQRREGIVVGAPGKVFQRRRSLGWVLRGREQLPGGEGGILNREIFSDSKVWQMRVASWEGSGMGINVWVRLGKTLWCRLHQRAWTSCQGWCLIWIIRFCVSERAGFLKLEGRVSGEEDPHSPFWGTWPASGCVDVGLWRWELLLSCHRGPHWALPALAPGRQTGRQKKARETGPRGNRGATGLAHTSGHVDFSTSLNHLYCLVSFKFLFWNDAKVPKKVVRKVQRTPVYYLCRSSDLYLFATLAVPVESRL